MTRRAHDEDLAASGSYKVSYYDELEVCDKVAKSIALVPRLGTMESSYSDNVQGLDVYVLKDNGAVPRQALVWLILKDRKATVTEADLSTAVWGTKSTVRWINSWTGGNVGDDTSVAKMEECPTRLAEKGNWHNRGLAGTDNGQGPHEGKDILLWITENP